MCVHGYWTLQHTNIRNSLFSYVKLYTFQYGGSYESLATSAMKPAITNVGHSCPGCCPWCWYPRAEACSCLGYKHWGKGLNEPSESPSLQLIVKQSVVTADLPGGGIVVNSSTVKQLKRARKWVTDALDQTILLASVLAVKEMTCWLKLCKTARETMRQQTANVLEFFGKEGEDQTPKH